MMKTKNCDQARCKKGVNFSCQKITLEATPNHDLAYIEVNNARDIRKQLTCIFMGRKDMSTQGEPKIKIRRGARTNTSHLPFVCGAPEKIAQKGLAIPTIVEIGTFLA
ncbi:hypothetical protein RF11_00630 [Thelohanellus kitauei]|uniref:Uncharacterized protein n=1 Tax=Thelohanellus kitauei TaxID=669202 RepID=A0A0C2I5Z6_THEKT|nr:hypothetical protein RF11_00630 [Thelohanellus kitauei]